MKVTEEQLLRAEEESDEDAPAPKIEKDEDNGYSYRLDRELDTPYDTSYSITKDGMAKSGTKMAKPLDPTLSTRKPKPMLKCFKARKIATTKIAILQLRTTRMIHSAPSP